MGLGGSGEVPREAAVDCGLLEGVGVVRGSGGCYTEQAGRSIHL